MLVSNRDDHLRNHGFLRTARGWRLAPAFDVNPSPQAREHSLALDDSIRIPDLDVVRGTAPLYRLSTARADETIGEVSRVTARWRVAAGKAELPAEEIERLAAAFPPA